MLRQLWDDECGAILSMEIVVVATVLVIALIAGWALLQRVVFIEMSNQAEWIAGPEHEQHQQDIEIDDVVLTADKVFGEGGGS